MYWVDGQIYKGDWEFGVQHGFGEITFVNGKVKTGKFENNVYTGKVKPETQKPEPLKENMVVKKHREKVDQGTMCFIKVSYEIMTQTDPIKAVMKDKIIQKSPEKKLLKERSIQTKSELKPKDKQVQTRQIEINTVDIQTKDIQIDVKLKEKLESEQK